MIACACAESAFGTSPHYKATGCPFNLQKPPGWVYPKCSVTPPRVTIANGKKVSVNFCMANDLADAARIWCEWIAHWPNARVPAHLAAIAGDPEQFAVDLYMVGFADGQRAKTMEFKTVMAQNDLKKFDKMSRPPVVLDATTP